MTRAVNTGRAGRIDPGVDYGSQYNYTTSTALDADQDGALITNLGATAAVVITMPTAVAGMEFPFEGMALYPFTATAAGSNVLNGTAGGSYGVAYNSSVVLGCLEDGFWDVIVETKASTGVVNVKDYGAVGDGSNDDTDAIQDAIDAAYAADSWVLVPPGSYKLTAQLTYKCAIRGSGDVSYPQTLTQLTPNMTDGTACIYVPTGSGRWIIEDLIIAHSAASDFASIQNYTGIRAGTWSGDSGGLGAATATPVGLMKNVRVYGAAIGFDIQGWNNRFDNIWADVCTLGYRGEYNNASVIDLNATNCGTAVIMEESQCQFSRLFDETGYRISPSLFDGCDNLTITNIYQETDGATIASPWISVGSKATTESGNSGECINFQVLSGEIGTVTSGPRVAFDRVDGFYLGVKQRGVSSLYTTTANSKGDRTTSHFVQSYTPTITATTTNPTVGASSLSGVWSRNGRVVTATANITMDATFAGAPGTGNYRMSLPVLPVQSGLGAYSIGVVTVTRTGVGNYVGYCSLLYNVGATGSVAFVTSNSINPLGAAGPSAVWANGDSILFTITYETV